jgi:hypothetical protein
MTEAINLVRNSNGCTGVGVRIHMRQMRAIMATVVFWLVGQHFYFKVSSAGPAMVKRVIEGAKGPRCYCIKRFQTGDDGRRR